VLLHGAFDDASSWSAVTKRLQADGFPVVVPAIPLTGLASDTASVRAVVGTITGPKVLVGHS
jgi:pimeloyl-ACP methyl ester carboxylesterase